MPSIAEIREVCETEMVWHYAVERRERVRAETLAGRDRSRKAPVGSPEHQHVVKGFAGLREAMDAKQAARLAAPKPFTAPVAEERPLFADRPLVSTPALADYLAKMRAPHEGEDEAIGFASEL